ncbi:hypothetical protein L1987_03459 [Smallanthus sonchifolius]|uniref:Uncharacterized protein n=1 Tax=Smallanthus sonchifolius TaxID=185202 RepID=A0ACB9KAS1_9ASTR|nr:hypothetical protein L1987_03459 [Smallanthus sonchifolius]
MRGIWVPPTEEEVEDIGEGLDEDDLAELLGEEQRHECLAVQVEDAPPGSGEIRGDGPPPPPTYSTAPLPRALNIMTHQGHMWEQMQVMHQDP